MTVVRVTEEPLDTGRELDSLPDDAERGAVVTFTGQVRGDGGLTALTLEHYPGMTEKQLHAIAETAAARFGLSDVRVAHRVGRMTRGDTIVIVVTAAPHRQAAFDGAAFLMDWLKTKAPFWKREDGHWGHRWVDARESDDRAAERWSQKSGEA
mgnify:CR=1 FL=1